MLCFLPLLALLSLSVYRLFLSQIQIFGFVSGFLRIFNNTFRLLYFYCERTRPDVLYYLQQFAVPRWDDRGAADDLFNETKTDQ